MKVALVHDYLKEYGGAERVVEALHEIFPDAPLYTAYYNPKSLGKDADRFSNWDIKVSRMQKIPGIGRLLSPLKFLSPLAFESFDLSAYDVVISSSAAYYAKGVITSQQSKHIAYIHTPPRYLYGYTNSHWYKKNILTRLFGEILNHFMRLYDFELSQRPDILVANSENIKQRIAKFYRRDAQVIYPPIDLAEYEGIKKETNPHPRPTNNKSFINLPLPEGEGRGEGDQDKRDLYQSPSDYYLSLARLDPDKNIDLVIKTFNQNGLPLKIVGTGREENKLKKLAKSNIQFLGKVSDKERITLLGNAKALICTASNEDFGITSVESQAAGTPVVALKEGGYLETVIDGKTGIFFEELAVSSLQLAVEKIGKTRFKIEDLRKNAEKYSKENFKKQILDLIQKYAH